MDALKKSAGLPARARFARWRRGLAGAACLALSLAGARAAVYYVDSETGDDARGGQSPEQAWKSLDKVGAQVFQPGDRLLFKAGTRYAGQLKLQGSGALIGGAPRPITLGRFGRGANARIDGEGRVLDTLLLRNISLWDIEDLELTNLGANRHPWQTGVHILDDGDGAMSHIHLRRLFVHDVNGDLRKNGEGCGIYFETRGGNDPHFDDLLIENCHLARTDRNGICQRARGRARSLRVVIRGNLLQDIGGDGIKLWGSNGGLIESNVLQGGRARCEDYAAGIWPFSCDDTVIQYNEVSGMKGTKDGQGFDSDYLCRRSLFQYNYSHDNEGGFMLVCTPGTSYNEDTVIRYNISQNDGIKGARVFHFGGGPKNTLVCNNTIYVGPGQDLPLLLFDAWDNGNASGTKFYNNIFYVDGHVSNDWGKSADNTFDSNVFFGGHGGMPPDPRAVTRRPPLLHPGSGGEGRASLSGYTLAALADFPAGRLLPENGGRDFFGRVVPNDRAPSIGACEANPPSSPVPPKIHDAP